MKYLSVSYTVTASVVVAVLCLLHTPAAAQYEAQTAKEDSIKDAANSTPRTADGHPNLSGYYYNPYVTTTTEKSEDGSIRVVSGNRVVASAGAGHAPPPQPEPSLPVYQPWAAAKVRELAKISNGVTNRNDPQLRCLPMGIPRVTMGPFQIIQTPGLTVILYESLTGMAYRVIPTDGRPHPKDIEPSFLGDSVAHWEGDTLVVDVIGLNDQTWLGGGEGRPEAPGYPRIKAEPNGLLHSDAEHVVERYSRKGDILTYETTVEDPKAFTKPWVITPRHFKIGDPNDRLMESFCNDRDLAHLVDGNSTSDEPRVVPDPH